MAQQPVDPGAGGIGPRPVEVPPPSTTRRTEVPGSAGGLSFKEILKQRQAAAVQPPPPGPTAPASPAVEEPIRFSSHALERMRLRKIELSPADVARLNQMVNKAAAKGAKESLILMDNLALVVSVKNRTVITAVDGASIKENVFTNIDSAVIL